MRPAPVTRECKRCEKETAFFARGLCASCYMRARKGGEFPTKKHELRDDHVDMSGSRCRCGLRLPCNDCLPPTATEYAQTHMYREEP